MASKIAFAACVFFAAHGCVAFYLGVGLRDSRHLSWMYVSNWALAWAFAYLAMI